MCSMIVLVLGSIQSDSGSFLAEWTYTNPGISYTSYSPPSTHTTHVSTHHTSKPTSTTSSSQSSVATSNTATTKSTTGAANVETSNTAGLAPTFPPWGTIAWLVLFFAILALGAGTAVQFGQAQEPGFVNLRGIVREMEDTSAASEAQEGDAAVTAIGGALLGVQTADCVPILIAHQNARCVAAIHAGWRGTAARRGS